MDNFNSLSAEGKAVDYALINKRIVYSTYPNQYTTSLALESTTLSAVGISGTSTYVPPGDTAAYSYSLYDTLSVAFVKQGSGQTNPFAISPHVWCRAKHYASQLTGFTGPDGNAYTTKTQTALTAWAETAGVKLPVEDISDIEMIVTNEAISSQDYLDGLPYLVPFKKLQALFYADALKGLAGYVVPQTAAKPQPIVFTNDYQTKLQWSTPNMLSNLIPDGEQYTYLKNLAPSYLGTGGDSGRPVFLQIGAKQVIVSHNWQVQKPPFGPVAPYFMTGPNYSKAYYVIKAFVEAQGDTLKTLEE